MTRVTQSVSALTFAGGLTDDLERVNERERQQLVAVEVFAAPRRVEPNSDRRRIR